MPDPHQPELDSDSSDFESSDFDNIDSSQRGFDQARATYESLVNTLPLSLLIKDKEGYRVFANHAYLKFRGSTLDELLGKRDEDLFPPDIARHFMEDDRQVMDSGEVSQDVEETIDAEGNRSWIERIKSPIFDRDYQVIGVQLLFWDVSDRILAEQELKHERDLLGTLLRHIPDCIYFKDRESRFLRISEAMATKFGLPGADAVLNKTDADIFSTEHAGEARADEIKVMETREPLVDRIEKETWNDREDSWCLSTKMPLIDDNDEVVGTFGISRDITELRRSQDELREARDAADRANLAKSEFLANMSHEIRTPMNAVIGMSELLAQTELNPEQRDYVQLVRDSADSLLGLLNDILDFSKIEARKLELESISFSIRDLVEGTGRALSVRAAEKGLELACRVAPDVPDRLIGDPGRLRQIMINLIGNAIKFTDEGELVVDVSRGQQPDAAPSHTSANDGPSDVSHPRLSIRFSVRDTGIGVPEEQQANILEAFTQADSSTTRRFGGTGLGLTISTQLVELMQGKLQFESRVGFGTTFYFTLPFEQAPSIGVDPKQQLKELGHLPVLVVDDNPTNRKILQEILTAWRFEPAMADGGKSALETMDAADQVGKPFSLAILDCMMPEMDGFELAQQIRERHDKDQIKLIILSSATGGDDLERCEQLGISRYMTKPVVQSELLDTVLQVMGMQPEPTLPAVEPLPFCPPLKVLVAEDGIANQHVAVGMLQAAGHQTVVASDGREAIASWRDEPFDVILMDMHMPVMDGIEATQQIRAEEQATGAHIPIIALTAAAMKKDAQACKDAGMDGYLPKPIHPRTLQEMLARYAPPETVMTEAELTTVNDRKTGTSFVLPGSTPLGERLADKLANHELVATDETIDLRAAASRVPGGLQGVRRLAEVFIPECQSLIQTLRDQIPDGDAGLVQRSAHTLKGAAQIFNAKKVSNAAQAIEQSAKSHDLAVAVDELHELEQQSELMLRALKNFLDITSDV
jgi:PAS domain S-box-containing protein